MFGGFSGAGAVADPLRLISSGLPAPGYYQIDTKVLVDPRLVASQRTGVIVTLGNSMITNHVEGTYSCTGQVDNLSLDNGGVYKAVEPLLGASLTLTPGRPSNYAMHLADKLIAAKRFDRIIIAPIGIGGTLIADWRTGGVANHRIGVLSKRLAGQGHTAAAVLLHVGENDHGVAQATAADGIQSIIDTFRAHSIASPLLVARASYNTGVTNGAIRSAQVSVLNGTDVFPGPDLDVLGSSYRVDNLHFNQAGAHAAAELWLPTLSQVL